MVLKVQQVNHHLIAPMECKNNEKIRDYLAHLAHESTVPITDIHYVDLNESMGNGGGPACLRLRMVLNEEEFDTINKRFILTPELYKRLLQCQNYVRCRPTETAIDATWC